MMPNATPASTGAIPDLRFRLAPWFLAGLCVLAITLLLSGGGRFFPGTTEGDLGDYFYQRQIFLHRWLARGVFPFWDPHSFCGYPVIETMQSGVLHPLMLLAARFLDPAFGVVFVIACNIAIGAALTYVGLRRFLATSPGAAAIGAAVSVFGGSFSGRITAGHMTVVAVHALMPFAACCAIRLAHCASRDRRPRMHHTEPAFIALAAAFALIIVGGAPQYILYTTFAIGVASLAAGLTFRASVRALLAVVRAAALGTALAAPQWIPALDYFHFSSRADTATAELYDWPALLASLLQHLFPLPLGDDLRIPNFYEARSWEMAGYVGCAALALALGAWARVIARTLRALRPRDTTASPAPELAGARWRRRQLLATLALVLLMLYLAPGGWYPGIEAFRGPLKARVVLAVALSLASALSFEEMRRRTRRAARLHRAGSPQAEREFQRARLGGATERAALVAVASAAVIGIAWQSLDPDSLATTLRALEKLNPRHYRPGLFGLAPHPGAWRASMVLALLGSLAALALLRRHRPAAPRTLFLFAILAITEPFFAHLHVWRPRTPVSRFQLPGPVVERLQRRISETTQNALPPWRVVLPPSWTSRSHQLEFIGDLFGYDPMQPYGATSRNVLFDTFDPSAPTDAAQPSGPAIRAQTARQALATGVRLDLRELVGPFGNPDSSRVLRFEGARIAGIERRVVAGAPHTQAFGPTLDDVNFVVPGTLARRPVAESETPPDFRATLQRIRDAASTAAPPTMVGTDTGLTSTTLAGLLPGERLEWLPRTRPHRVELRLRLAAPALVVLRETWLPGWSSTVTRTDTSTARAHTAPAWIANHWMIAAPAEPGESLVAFEYRPVRWEFSWAVCIAAHLLFATLLLLRLRHRRSTR